MLRKPFHTSVVFFIILFVLLAVFSFISSQGDFQLLYAKLAWSLVVAYFGFCIYRSGIISKYRSRLFILIAVFFILGFKSFFSPLPSGSPSTYCHIALAPTLLNFIHSQYLALISGEWKVWGPLTLGFLWLLIMFTIGQGICSWVCFYGGLDEACSKLRKKPLIKLNVNSKWRDFPLAFLIFLLIISFLEGLPVFCTWFCPFKFTDALWDSDLAIRIIQIILFCAVLLFLVILLPFLSKKRTFCSLICPFGALVSICGQASPYKTFIKKDKCILCGKCLEVCPVFAIEAKDAHEYRISFYCNKCGKCMDVCPAGAISMSAGKDLETISPTQFFGTLLEARDIFVFLALLITGVISGTFVPREILQLLGGK